MVINLGMDDKHTTTQQSKDQGNKSTPQLEGSSAACSKEECGHVF